VPDLNTTAGKSSPGDWDIASNARFVHSFFGRMFNHPQTLFNRRDAAAELQDREIFADGVDNIVATQKRVAKMYFDDAASKQACPPLQALLHIS